MKLKTYLITLPESLKRNNVLQYRSTSKRALKRYLKEHNIKYIKIKKLKKGNT
jgi:hypothetical protein